ncbi:MAG: DUF4174 domain-containing protein [Rhodobacteraceae bacterium]|nr:DUF4174 domain-containing protein [Paracoccaceae bacterium]
MTRTIRTFAIVLTSLFPFTVLAADPAQPAESSVFSTANDATLDSFRWVARPIIVFADSPDDPRLQQQIDLLKDGEAMLADRDVVVLTDTDPAAKSPLRIKLRPRGFQMVLIDKDGGVKLRKPSPWTVREITRIIDQTPLRLREVEERREKRNAQPANP